MLIGFTKGPFLMCKMALAQLVLCVGVNEHSVANSLKNNLVS